MLGRQQRQEQHKNNHNKSIEDRISKHGHDISFLEEGNTEPGDVVNPSLGHKIDVVSRVVFPVTFFAYVIVYITYYYNVHSENVNQ